MQVIGSNYIFERGEVGKEWSELEGTADAGSRQEVRTLPGYIFTIELNLAGRRADDAGDEVKDSGLAGSVWPDQPNDLALTDAHAEMIDGNQPAKILG